MVAPKKLHQVDQYTSAFRGLIWKAHSQSVDNASYKLGSIKVLEGRLEVDGEWTVAFGHGSTSQGDVFACRAVGSRLGERPD